MDSAIPLLHLVFDNTWFKVIGGLLALNVLTGIAAALYQGNFVLGALAEWLRTRAVPYVIVDGAMQLFFLVAVGGDNPTSALGSTGLSTVLGDAVHVMVIASLAAHALTNLQDMGLRGVPNVLTNGVISAVPDTSRRITGGAVTTPDGTRTTHVHPPR